MFLLQGLWPKLSEGRSLLRGKNFTISVHMKSVLIRESAFGRSSLIRGAPLYCISDKIIMSLFLNRRLFWPWLFKKWPSLKIEIYHSDDFCVSSVKQHQYYLYFAASKDWDVTWPLTLKKLCQNIHRLAINHFYIKNHLLWCVN